MPWNEANSRKRITAHLQTVPAFDEHISLATHRKLLVEARLLDSKPNSRAFVVEGAHLYGQLLDFEKIVADADNRETEASHRNVLRFLHMHYQIWDSIVDEEGADRIDYHGARLHAVVTDPVGDPHNQVERAVALAAKLSDASARIADAYGYPARIRFGIDQGRCIAMSTGRGHEKDTLFLGTPANHAAKVAAAGDQPGVFLANGAQIASSLVAKRTVLGDVFVEEASIKLASSRHQFPRIDLVVGKLVADAKRDLGFVFHRPRPPLASLKFSELVPSNSARRGMASIFADVSGFTPFVDNAIKQGSNSIKAAATAIHVIREELNDVLKIDFGGKRVRFIGDCIQGVIAEGVDDDAAETIRESAFCASGMRSSFSLVQTLLPKTKELDLAIGIEYGTVPLTRLGLTGANSIRCAAGRAVIVSERVQQSLNGGGVRLGPVASGLADRNVKRHYETASTILEYDAAADLLGSIESPAVAIVREDRSARPYSA
jgi:class 3 adenylate cyclase